MNRALTAIAMTGVIFVAAQALAVDSIGQPKKSKRQTTTRIVDCMKRRMSADKAISYNQSAKDCKDQINKQRDDAMSGTLVASDTPAKP